ncbi:arsenate reductase (glutaredoxin) [Winogradskyella ursingii]|uniref:arsenate reductase (glutaredoxin) n=1 Tax=Winogradskyella ursingii TaxID=2686079 RepID=UPI0015C829D5|nr:arsenate reductase (glutaredoxin) [Winogradskyella ursingii]
MITIFHNPRCSKSREGLALLEESGKEFEVVRYLENTLSVAELKELIKKLGIKPVELVRKNEAIWKSEYKDQDLTDNEILEAMVRHPKLIERPIVVYKNKAVVGRPSEKILEII